VAAAGRTLLGLNYQRAARPERKLIFLLGAKGVGKRQGGRRQHLAPRRLLFRKCIMDDPGQLLLVITACANCPWGDHFADSHKIKEGRTDALFSVLFSLAVAVAATLATAQNNKPGPGADVLLSFR
jgi:hypothetical protein